MSRRGADGGGDERTPAAGRVRGGRARRWSRRPQSSRDLTSFRPCSLSLSLWRARRPRDRSRRVGLTGLGRSDRHDGLDANSVLARLRQNQGRGTATKAKFLDGVAMGLRNQGSRALDDASPRDVTHSDQDCNSWTLGREPGRLAGGWLRSISPALKCCQRRSALDARRRTYSRPVSLFREDASLSESVRWLQEIYLRRLEERPGWAELEELVLKLLGDGLLPAEMNVKQVNSDGLWGCRSPT